MSIPVRIELSQFKSMSMAGGLLKRCVVKALVIVSVIALIALNTSILVLTAKSYDITRQLGTQQAPMYSTGGPPIWAKYPLAPELSHNIVTQWSQQRSCVHRNSILRHEPQSEAGIVLQTWGGL